jgi:hypothetical protein
MGSIAKAEASKCPIDPNGRFEPSSRQAKPGKRALCSPEHQPSYNRDVSNRVLLTAVLLLVGCVRAFKPGSSRQDLSGGATPDSAATDSASTDGTNGGGLDASTDLPPPRSYTQVVTVAGSGTGGNTDGPALQATLNAPHGIALGPGGAILITNNHSVRRIAGGQVTTLAGSGQPGFQDGAAAQARFDRPEGIAVDSAGRIHVGDFNNHRMRLIDGSTVSTVRDEVSRRRLLAGRLGRYVEGFAEQLCEQGYRPCGVTYRLRIVGAFAQWLDLQGVVVRNIDGETVSRFLRYRWKRRSRNGADEPDLKLFLEHLRQRRVVRPTAA